MKYILIILLYVNYFVQIKTKSNNEEKIPKEIIHGIPQNATLEKGMFYEYYIDISNYDLNEENMFELYGINFNIYGDSINLYYLYTNITNVELIKNETIKPDLIKDKYEISEKNIIIDILTDNNYFFFPIKKSNLSYNYLIILIQNLVETIPITFYISERIQTINIAQKHTNIVELINKEIEIRDDIRLYYKINLANIDLINNNVHIFIKKFNNTEKELETFYCTDLSSLNFKFYNIFSIKKNSSDFSEIYVGIKNKNNYNQQKYVNLQARIDTNKFYRIDNNYRNECKIYIEDIKIDKYIFIIEDYNLYVTNKYFYLTFDSLYGNFSVKLYRSISDLNFEKYFDEDEYDIKNYLIPIYNLVNVYILKSFTPTAFYFEIFSKNNFPLFLPFGSTIKTTLPSTDDFIKYVYLKAVNSFIKYKVHVKILDVDETNKRIFECLFHSQGKDNFVQMSEPALEHTEIIYSDDFDRYYPHFSFKSTDFIIIEYYSSYNKLYTNVAEGRTIIYDYNQNSAFKIRKSISFDYISLEAKCADIISGEYEIKLINNQDIETDLNIIMVGLPNVKMEPSNYINLKFANPYDKYVQYDDINNEENNYYLLIKFKVSSEPVILDINYIYNEQIAILPAFKSKIIVPNKEYEIIVYSNNFVIKDKLMMNINKCNDKENYNLINYYLDLDNIIKEIPITDSHQIITLDNKYSKIKMILKEESEKNETKNESIIYPAEYYNKGDILLNYFLIESSIYKELKFTSNYTITYEEETWSEIILSWEEYVYREINNDKINIATNYSIYILPKDSVVNTICQLNLIPSNKSIVNTTQIKINLEEGEYKIVIIANVINNEMPFEIMYDFIELNIIKKINIVLIVLSSLFGFIIILVILFFIFRKKIMFYWKKRRSSINISDINNSKSLQLQYEEEYEEEEDEEDARKKRTEELMKMMSAK